MACFRYVTGIHWNLQLTHWSRVLIEKLTIAQLVKNFCAIYGTRSFITVFTRARHWSPFWARWIQSTSSKPLSLRPILILSFDLRADLPRCLFPSELLTKIWMHLSSIPCMLYASLFHPPWFDEPNSIWWRLSTNYTVPNYVIFPPSCCFVPLVFKYCPQHPVVKHS
jgi:hypothetical protein